MKPFPLHALTGTDSKLLYWLNRHSHKRPIGRISRQISRLGDGPLYALIGSLLALTGDNGLTFFITGLAAYMLELPIYWVLKNSIRRPRPKRGVQGLAVLITPSDTFSFPSGHTAGAFVFATLIAAFFPAWAPLTYSMAILIGLSRVMLGVHYPSDIAVGACLGIVCAECMLWLQPAMILAL